MKTITAISMFWFSICGVAVAQSVDFDWATIGNPGNLADNDGNGYGSVDYVYRISKHEVTNQQYAVFLNSVAATDAHGLFDGQMENTTVGGIVRSGTSGSYFYSVKPAVGSYTYDDKPVVWVDYFDAMRFANWTHNGQPIGSQNPATTEDGTYELSLGRNAVRKAGAQFWLPSEDEWYKAAYYDPGTHAYYDYATGSDILPDNHDVIADSGNSANYYNDGWSTGNQAFPLTTVGGYSLSASPYGTHDQAGSVWEWTDSQLGLTRIIKGGSWNDNQESLNASRRQSYNVNFDNEHVGFRVASVSADVVFDWVVVGNPGNPPDRVYTPINPDRLQFGAVNYTFRISKHEVTNAQYVDFLNSVAASDPHDLFNQSMEITRSGNKGSFTYSVDATYETNPVNYVSFFDAMRFTNWLHNGQGTGSTESGAYTIENESELHLIGGNETRSAGARFFIPSEDEWYKAAYYDPRLASEGGPPGDDFYWLYPTQHDIAPTAELPPGGINSANSSYVVGDNTDVGAYINTTSFYGTFDQGGNLWELNEAVIFTTKRGLRGGSWLDSVSQLAASSRNLFRPDDENFDVGFRVASLLPGEPTMVAPESFTVTRGEYISGGLPELTESDNMNLSLRRLNIDTQSRTEFEVKSTSPTASPTTFEFTLEGAVIASSNVVQTIELFDYDASVWELVDTRNAASSPAPEWVVTVAPVGDLSRFVEAGTMCIKARVRYKSDSPRQNFTSNTDQTIWMIQ